MQPSGRNLVVWPLLFALLATAARQSGHANEPAKASQQSARLAEQTRRPPSGADLSAPTQPAAYQLPSWFNFEAFKSLHGKQYATGALEELHKRIYLRTALRVLEQRAHFRAGRRDSLASVDELSDLTSAQLASFWAGERRTTVEQPAETLPVCCSYDQVYGRIIAMLRRASEARDLELSRALLAELEASPRAESPHSNSNPNLNPTPNPNPNFTSNLTPPPPPPVAIQTTRQLPKSTLAPRPLDLRARRKRPELADAHQVGVETRPAASVQLPAGLEEAVRQQVSEQLGPEAPLGRLLNRQLSEYFGEPVRLRARPVEIKKTI